MSRVLHRLIEVGLKLKPTKCQFIRKEVEFLGHVITPEGLKTSQCHIDAVTKFPAPKTVTEVRQFMGLASYYRRLVKSFATVAQPLHALTRKGASFVWSVACQEAFAGLKKRLTAAPILAYPSFGHDFILETDASIQGVGAVLSQYQEDQKLHPVAFASRALNPAERNYSITDLETLAVVSSVSHFRTYLYGQRVTVYTDHAAVLQNPNTSGRHARWWTKVHSAGLQEITILYRAGKENPIADALSRNPQAPAPHQGVAEGEVQVARIDGTPPEGEDDNLTSLLQLEPTPEQPKGSVRLAQEQRQDAYLLMLIQYLEEGKLPDDSVQAKKIVAQSNQYVLCDGVLYLMDKKCARKRAAVPAQLRTELIEGVHGGPLAGHFSSNRIFHTLSRSWWWEGMYNDVRTHCKNCPQCAVATGASRPGQPPLQPIPVSRPFQIFGVDVMDLPKTERGNKHVIVFQDFLTKWPVVVPIPDQKTTRIVRILVEEIVSVFGVPEALLSDRGTNLLSYLMKDVCGLLGIEKYNTTAYHPQCNGMTERFNRTLKTMLRKHAAKYGNQWDKYLHGAVWAYRNTPHESTHEKPSFLMFGRDCRTPTEAALLPPEPIEAADVGDYRQELIMTLSNARKMAAESIQGAQVKYKRNYDCKCRVQTYQLGEWIMIYFPQEESGADRKLSRPWHGPYRVVSSSETGVTAVKVYRLDESTIQVHQSRVCRCPEAFPAGFYWYGPRRSKPGRPPKWVDQLLTNPQMGQASDAVAEDKEPEPEAGPIDLDSETSTSETTCGSMNGAKDTPAIGSQGVDQQGPLAPPVRPAYVGSRTRTRKIVPPTRLMFIRSGRAK